MPAEPPVNLAVNLPRGGVWVPTSAGPIQFGIPPETIKDSMEMGLAVPAIYVVPKEPFDRQRGTNVAEFEFPAYYNFFLHKRRIVLAVHDTSIEMRLRTVIQESLFGPERSSTADEYPRNFPEDGRANFVSECGDYFRRGGKGKLTVDDLVDFVHFDSRNIARIPGSVEIEILEGVPGGYVVRDGGREIAWAPQFVKLPARQSTSVGIHPFEPPQFGITVLGTSHGFDPEGKTTGFLLWLGGRGILVDPPVGATDYLRRHGVPTKLVQGVIVTHCHADHDSGAFQKLLEESKIELYTTPTILGSFLRKYSALSGIGPDLLRRTFTFRPVTIGEPTRIHGAEVRFFYQLHSIPTIGFEAFYGGKSLAFSSDTLYDPARIRAMEKEGVLGARRAQDLIDFPWHHTVVLHEAGIPPLHTPLAALAALPAHVKENLHLVHIADKDLPPDLGLHTAPVGIGNTIRIEAAAEANDGAVALLDSLCSVDLFHDFSMSNAREFLRAAKRKSYPVGTKIIAEGTPGNTFYVVSSGEVSVRQNGTEIKTYRAGDYFGETAIVLAQPRNADVFARTDVELVEIERYDFLYLLRGTDVLTRLVRLARLRDERSWEVFLLNSVFRGMSSSQKTQLQSWLEVRPMQQGETLWRNGDDAIEAFIVDEGHVSLELGPLRASIEGRDHALAPFGPGAFIGEVDAVLAGGTTRSTAKAVSSGKLFRISGKSLAGFFESNPGLMVSFLGTAFLE